MVAIRNTRFVVLGIPLALGKLGEQEKRTAWQFDICEGLDAVWNNIRKGGMATWPQKTEATRLDVDVTRQR